MTLPSTHNNTTNDLAITQPILPSLLVNGTLSYQKKTVKAEFSKNLKKSAKDIQVEGIVSLVNGLNTFILAATGVGKSSIAIAFLLLYPMKMRPVMIVINPLDALGDNQVLQLPLGITGINLTKVNATDPEVWTKLKNHHYRVIFLSPEMFLNSGEFQKLYYSPDFQKHLVLKVVDEAHVIYSWGLVESGKTKGLQSHTQLADVCDFRPHYGDLGRALTATDTVPLLLLSATCRPIALEEIWKSLKLTPQNRVLIQGELCRPEIRMIRMYLTRPLKTAEDVAQLIPHKSDVHDSDLASTIIYSGQVDATQVVSQQVHIARGHPTGADDGNSACCRTYHSSIGPQDKLTRSAEYGEGSFRIISATTALGLGQDWHEVEMVVVMGAMDPDVMIQMAGRGGRGDKDSLVIFLVEPHRAIGQNSLDDFPDQQAEMRDDDRMHAFRVTPVCLRVALNCDTLYGRIPLSLDDPIFIKEKARQEAKGMKACQCSVCDPAGAIELVKALKTTDRANFQSMLNRPTVHMPIPDISFLNPRKIAPLRAKDTSRRPLPCLIDDPIRSLLPMIDLAKALLKSFQDVFNAYYPDGSNLNIKQLFNQDHAWDVVKNYKTVILGQHLRGIFGSEPLPKTWESIKETIQQWSVSPSYQVYLDLMAQDRAREQAHYEAAASILAAYEESQQAKATLRAEKKAKNEEKIRTRLHQEELELVRKHEKKEKLRLKLQSAHQV